jgi:hypothetical protein
VDHVFALYQASFIANTALLASFRRNSFAALLLKLWGSKSASGISLKTQELFLLVFVTR